MPDEPRPSRRVSGDGVRAWVESTCAAQGVPVVVTDPVVLRRVGALLTGIAGDVPRRASAEHAPGGRSQPPDRLHPVGVEHLRAGGAGEDDCMVEQGPHDGVLPVEVQGRPRTA